MGGTLTLSQGALPAITTPQLTIVGPGLSAVTIDAQGNSGILSIDSGSIVSVSGLTLAQGSSASGGAIDNGGTLTLTQCAITGDTASLDGGGIDNDGTLMLNQCSIRGNTSKYGGGLYNSGTAMLFGCTIWDDTSSSGGGIENAGMLSLTDCTITGNTSNHGGGLYSSGTASLYGCTISDDTSGSAAGIESTGMLSLTDSTVSGNTAVGAGGILNDEGSLKLTACTISGNTSTGIAGGGGIENYSGELSLTDSTVYGNTASIGGGIFDLGRVTQLSSPPTYATATLNDCTVVGNTAVHPADGVGGIENYLGKTVLNDTIVAMNPGGDLSGNASGENNLIDDVSTGGGFVNGVAGNLVGVAAELGPLASNGGPTQTIALLAGSPAIDAGDSSLVPAGVTTDQRGRRASRAAPWISAPSRAGNGRSPSPRSPTRGPAA